MFCRRKRVRSFEEGELGFYEFKNKIKQGAILLDVRSKQEFAEGHIQGAINIPEHEIDKIVEKKIPNKKQLILIYCQSGVRSRSAYVKMKRKGYLRIYNLNGGLDMI